MGKVKALKALYARLVKNSHDPMWAPYYGWLCSTVVDLITELEDKEYEYLKEKIGASINGNGVLNMPLSLASKIIDNELTDEYKAGIYLSYRLGLVSQWIKNEEEL